MALAEALSGKRNIDGTVSGIECGIENGIESEPVYEPDCEPNDEPNGSEKLWVCDKLNRKILK